MGRAPADRDPQQVDDSTLRGFLGYTLKRAYLTVQADFSDKLAAYDMRTAVFSVLVLIVDNPGTSQSAIANALAVERSAMVLLIDELEERGFVVREKSPNDRRTYALYATEAGEVTCREMRQAVVAHEDGLTARLSKAEKETLIALLQRVRAG